ncbi:MAG: hypothetical protein J0M34_04600 [Alphaproteobacteria bacterium]|nr:hypothetical protein [Alphaproteobacteria bacterium]
MVERTFSSEEEEQRFLRDQSNTVRENRQSVQQVARDMGQLRGELADYDIADSLFRTRRVDEASAVLSASATLTAEDRQYREAQRALDNYNPSPRLPREASIFNWFPDPGLSREQISIERARLAGISNGELADLQQAREGLVWANGTAERATDNYNAARNEIIVTNGQRDVSDLNTLGVHDVQRLARFLRDVEYQAAGETVSRSDDADGINGPRTRALMRTLGIDTNNDGNYTQAELAELRTRVDAAMLRLAEAGSPETLEVRIARTGFTGNAAIERLAAENSRYTTIHVDSLRNPGTSAADALSQMNSTSVVPGYQYETQDLNLSLDQRASIAAIASRYRAQTAEYTQALSDLGGERALAIPNGFVIVRLEGRNQDGSIGPQTVLVPRGELIDALGGPSDPQARLILSDLQRARSGRTD